MMKKQKVMSQMKRQDCSCSIAQSCLTLWLHGLQHARPPRPSQLPAVCSDSSPLSWWCHPTISSSVTPFSSCLQSFPALGSSPVSQLFASGGQRIGDLASASVLPVNIQGLFPLRFTGSPFKVSPLRFIGSPCCPRDSQESSPAPQCESINSLVLSLLYGPTITSVHDYWKTTALTTQIFVCKVMFLLFNTLSRFVIAFLPRSKHLLISWLHSPSTVILELKKIKSLIVSISPPSIYHEVMGPDAMILIFWMLSFKPAFSLSSFHFHEEAL